MFYHNFKYAMKSLFRTKTMIFWSLLFPIGLATFMYVAFGNLMENDEMFCKIPVAVVKDTEEDSNLLLVLSSLSTEGENQYLDAMVMEEEKALKALDDEEVAGIIYVKDVRLVVKENDVKQTILQTILNQYKQTMYLYQDIEDTSPEMVAKAMEQAMADVSYFTESSTTDGCQNAYYNYFYAIFAMSCLFASFTAIEKINRIQANISPLGMRRCLSPNKKMVTVMAEYLAFLIVQFAIEVITLLYLTLLGVDFGNKYPAILLVLFVGCNIGIAMGVIIGSAARLSESAKVGIAVAISMVMSVMADLCAAGIKDMIEHKAPIINRLNPAALISDCFYSLNVYDNYDRFFGNLVILLVMTFVLVGIGVFRLRRNKYASL